MRRLTCAAAVMLLAGSVLLAQDPPQFRFERAITAAPGAQRLAIDVPLLVGSQPFGVVQWPGPSGDSPRLIATGGLGDLRLYDQTGREVPYLIVPPPATPDRWAPGRVLPIAATKKTSGFEADLDEPLVIDRIRVDGIPPPFLKRILVEGSGDREHWTVLLSQATLFDLPDQRLRQTELIVPRGTYRYLRGTWDDTNSAVVPLPRMVAARLVSTARSEAGLTATFTAVRASSEPRRSRYRVTLPAGRMPIVAFEPQVNAPYVFRESAVSESRLAGGRLEPFILGHGQLRQVVRDGLTASAMRIPVVPPSEAEVDLSVNDGDNGPLAIGAVVAHLAEMPWIYFESPGGSMVARWGDRRSTAPRYDLEAARASLAIESVPDATWGEVRTLAPATAVSPPNPMPNAGAPLETDRFRYSRPIPSGEPGLIAVPLDAAVLAHSTGVPMSFADVRVADANGRQVPYLVEQRDEPLSIELKIEPRGAPAAEPAAASRRRSYYRVTLPYTNLPPWTLALSTNATIFDRQISLAEERPADRAHRDNWIGPLTAARWVHADREQPAPSLPLRGQSTASTDLVLVVDEGDNSPLPLTSARLLLPSYRLRLFQDPGASLRLVYGRDDLGPPSYDLALLSASVLGVPAREVAPAAEEAGSSAATPFVLGSPRLFWSVLVIAVIGMLVVLARLIRRES
jgi:uncharacterized protein DUF3999